MKAKIYACLYHDTYTDENGKQISYTDKVIAVVEGRKVHFSSVPDFMTFTTTKKEFEQRTTDLTEIFLERAN